LDKKQRLLEAFDLEMADRPPILGGWLAAPGHIQALADCSDDEYWSDPFYWGVEAERTLGSDGVIGIFAPIARGGYRCVDGRVLERWAEYTVERVLEEIEAMPDPDQIEEAFDPEVEYEEFIAEFQMRQEQVDDMLWCPAGWELIPRALWYHAFGYEASMMTMGLHPERYHKLLEVSTVRGRQRAEVWARAIAEGIAPPAILTGEDICSQQGPMVSPEYLRKEYFPRVEYTIEPLLEVGAKLVWHCDGNYRPLVDDVLACGLSGLQGFQRECGMELEWIVDLRTRDGDPLLIFGPLQVTTTLPLGTPEDVRREVNRARELCRGKASLVHFTSNTINPDVPLENIRAYWDEVLNSRW
jgi:hypothetical protein